MSQSSFNEIKILIEEQGYTVEVALESMLVINKKLEYSPILNKWIDLSDPLPLVCHGNFEMMLSYLKARLPV